MTSCAVTISNPLGLHARAAARFVHAASGFSLADPRRARRREMDGKSIMGLLLLAAAQGSRITITADGADEEQAMAALCALVERGFDESRHAPDRTRRVARHRHRQGARAQARHARPAVPRAGLARRARARAARRGPRARARADSSRSRQRIATTAGAEHAYLFDAQLLMLDDAMLVGRAAEIDPQRAAERRVGAAARARADLRALRPGAGSLPARAQGRRRRRRRPAVHEPARGRRSRRAVQRPRGAAGARRRRGHAVGDRAARLAAPGRDSSPTPAAGRITRRSSRARSTCRPSPGCTTPASIIPPGALVAVDGATGEVLVDPDADTLDAGRGAAAAPAGLRAVARRVPRPAGRSPRTASRSGSRPTSRRRTTRRARASAAPKASACSDPSSCSPAAGQAALTEEAQYRAYRQLVESAARPARHDSDVRRQRAAAPHRARRDRRRARAARAARHPAQPGDRRDLPGAAARAAARRGARAAAHHVPVRLRRRGAARGARRRRAGRRRRCAPAATRCRTCRSAS